MKLISSIAATISPMIGSGWHRNKSSENSGIVTVTGQPLPTYVNPRQSNGAVYVIAADRGRVKVGRSVNVQNRLAELQTSASTKLKLICSVDVENAARVERVAHILLKDSNSYGEWFRCEHHRAIAALAEAVAIVEDGNSDRFIAEKTAEIRGTTPARSKKGFKPPVVSKIEDSRDVILEFLANVTDPEDENGGFISFKNLRFCYDQWRPRHGWPHLTDKTLAQSLVRAGCHRRQIDARGQGKGRYIAFRVPSEMGLAA